MTYDVFISYSSKDKAIADGIVSTLEQNNIRCWYAPRDIKPSEDWGMAIANAIQETNIFLMVFSGNSNQSQHVLDELLFAIDAQAVVLPYRIENLEPAGAMKLHLSSRHWLDAYDPSWESHLKELAKSISLILETKLDEKQIKLPPKYSKRPRKLNIKRILLVIGMLLTAVLVGLLLQGRVPQLLAQKTSSSQPVTLNLPAGSSQVSPADEMVQVYIPQGSFLMGSESGVINERPVHMVDLDGFWMDEHEVTNSQFVAFLNDQGNQEEGKSPWLNTADEIQPIELVGDTWVVEPVFSDHPVVNVSWYGARAYCEWAGRRLPTEAEWEKAARGSLDGKNYPWGDSLPVCENKAENGARFDDDLECNSRGTTSIMNYAPNGYGLYDMAGNVWEWVSDHYLSYYYFISPEENPPGPAIGLHRVMRGGGWFTDSYHARVSYREWDQPASSFNVVGFRCSDSLE